jgi:hypothetical protein
MSKIHKDNWNAQLCNNHLQLAALAYQIARHEQSAASQIRKHVEEFWHKPAYGKAPRAKPDNCVQVIMETFNSLGVFTNGTKINALNKICREFKADVLAWCETQADWCQATEEQQLKIFLESGWIREAL